MFHELCYVVSVLAKENYFLIERSRCNLFISNFRNKIQGLIHALIASYKWFLIYVTVEPLDFL